MTTRNGGKLQWKKKTSLKEEAYIKGWKSAPDIALLIYQYHHREATTLQTSGTTGT